MKKNASSLLLIVEDNIELADFIRQTLQEKYKILTAANGVEGLHTALKELPDIIISDVMMPEMDGFELCKRVKKNEKTSHIPFILLTAKVSHDSVMEGLESRADDYISKPFHIDELQLRIYNILDHQQKVAAFL